MYTLTTSCQCQNLYGSSTPSSWDGFHSLGCLHHSMCGPMKDNHVTIPQAAPYYRLFACAHTITQLWGFRFLETSYIILRAPYPKVHSLLGLCPRNGLRTGKKMRASSQRCRKNSLQRLERPALRDEFRESWGEDMAKDLELIPIDILLVTRTFIMKTTGLWPWLSLDIIGSNISGTSGRLHTFPSSFKHYAAHGFWAGQLHWEMLRPRVQVASASNPNMYPLVVKPGDRKSCLYSWFSYWNIGFPWPGYAIGGCTCQKLDYRWS